MQSKSGKILVGRIAGVYGVKGWLKVHSFTRPIENILAYSPWFLDSRDGLISKLLEESKHQGKNLVAKLADIENREQARSLIHSDILVEKNILPALAPGEYYWHDIIGLSVRNTDGQDLGIVRQVLETGANDVIVVEGEQRLLIPWVKDEFVIDIDLEAGQMQVDWHGNQ